MLTKLLFCQLFIVTFEKLCLYVIRFSAADIKACIDDVNLIFEIFLIDVNLKCKLLKKPSFFRLNQDCALIFQPFPLSIYTSVHVLYILLITKHNVRWSSWYSAEYYSTHYYVLLRIKVLWWSYRTEDNVAIFQFSTPIHLNFCCCYEM